MLLNDALKAAAIEELRKLDLSLLGIYAERHQKVLDFLYTEGIIDDNSIEHALEEAIFRQARQDFITMTAKVRPYATYADHVGRPECLAYVLERGKFSGREIKKIPFDHGDTAETFTRQYRRENLPSVLREELLHPKSLSDFFAY